MKDLILISLKAQQKYVVEHIKSPTGQFFYKEMMNDILYFIQALDNYNMALVVLETSFMRLRNAPLSLNKELKYKRLALKHATEVVISIHNRFNGKLYAQG